MMLILDRKVNVKKLYHKHRPHDDVIYRKLLVFLKLATHWSSDRTANQIATAIANSTATYIAYSDNEIVGFGRIVSDLYHVATLTDICVHPEFRGMAIATRIVEALCKEAPYCEKVFAHTSQALNFYVKLGFVEFDGGTLVLRR